MAKIQLPQLLEGSLLSSREYFTLKQIPSDNDASGVGILGHFRTRWDIFGQFGRLFDEFGSLKLFPQSFPTIFIHYRLI